MRLHQNTHEEQVHRTDKKYSDCQFCHRFFEEDSDFTQHLIFHKVKMPEELKHPCEKCDKSFEVCWFRL